MKRIKIFMLHLGFGGVERQTINMANALTEYYQIEIISFYKLEKNPAYKIDDRIKIKYLYIGGPNRDKIKEAIKKLNIFVLFKEIIKAVKILWLKRKLIIKEIKENDYDIGFSTRTEYGKYLSKYANQNILTLTQEHNFIEDIKYKKKIIKNYKNLNYVVVISKYHEKMYKEWFKNTKVKIARIENCLDEGTDLVSKLNNKSLIAVGRFNYIKDFSSLIEVMKYVNEKDKSIKLYLLGDGEEKQKLELKVKEHNLENYVIMPGFLSNDKVKEYMLKSDIYLMTSFKECFPMVLLEANNCGIPVISFDILTGPKEIIVNNKNGYLIKDRNCKEMANKILELINDKKCLKNMGKYSKEISTKYLVNNIIKKWRKIFK